MKDIKVQHIIPAADPKTARKPGGKSNATGESFSKTLNSTVASLNDLNEQIPGGSAAKVRGADSAEIKKEISDAKESFDKMMLEKQKLFLLYQHITSKEDN